THTLPPARISYSLQKSWSIQIAVFTCRPTTSFLAKSLHEGHSNMANWREKLEKIKNAQIEIMRSEPYKDFGLVPNPAASDAAIAVAENRLGVELPASYRAFLRLYDGWPRFYEGASLLGTANLGRREHQDVVQSVLQAAETP